VQLAWWSVLVLSSIITILLAKDWQIPDLSTSTLYLLGISGTTTATATLIDISDQNNSALSTLSQNQQGENFFLDMLSDNNGVSVHRFQTVVFNLVFGIWFMRSFLININGAATDVNTIIPSFTDNNLILLGVSSGLYAATKAMENKKSTSATTTQTTGQTN
jgi:hypothetical protein